MDSIKGLFENEFFNAGFALGVITAVLLYFKTMITWLWRRIERKLYYSISIECTDNLYGYFERWLSEYHNKEYRRLVSFLGESRYAPDQPFITKDNGKENEVTEVAKYKQESDLIFIKYKGRHVKINKLRKELQQTQTLYNFFFDSFVISTLFHRKVLYEMMDEVVEYNQQFKPNIKTSIYIEFHDDYGNWGNKKVIVPKTIKQIVLHKDIKNGLIDDIDKFLSLEDWYGERAIPYKRGYLFYGSPGNGKTSLAGALARHVGRTISVINLSELKDSSLKVAFNNLPNKSIVLIEDIDSIFDGRKSNKEHLTFSNFLQCLDGFSSQHDMIVIITTNHISKLDDAVLRDGRIDMRVNIENPTSSLVDEYVSLFYQKDLHAMNGQYDERFSMSTIQNICLSCETEHDVYKKLLV